MDAHDCRFRHLLLGDINRHVVDGVSRLKRRFGRVKSTSAEGSRVDRARVELDHGQVMRGMNIDVARCQILSTHRHDNLTKWVQIIAICNASPLSASNTTPDP